MKIKNILLIAAGVLALVFFRNLRLESNTKQEQIMVLGSSIDLSKGYKNEGEDTKEGLDAYVRKLNSQGGVKGRQVKLVVLDDGYTPETAVKNYKELIERHKAHIILSPFGSPTTAAAIEPFVKPKKMLIFFPYGSGEKIYDYEYMLNWSPRYSHQDIASVTYLKKDLKIDKVAVLLQDDEAGEGMEANLQKVGYKKGDYVLMVYDRNKTKFEQQVKKFLDFKDGQGIFYACSTTAAIEFMRQAKTENLVGKKMVGSQISNPEFDEFMKQQGLNQQFYDFHTAPKPDGNMEILAEYRQAMGSKKLSKFSALAWIKAAVLFYIISKIEGPITKTAIINQAKKMNETYKGIELKWNDKMHCMHPYLYVIKGGTHEEKIEIKI